MDSDVFVTSVEPVLSVLWWRRTCHRTSVKHRAEVLFDIMMLITDGALLWCSSSSVSGFCFSEPCVCCPNDDHFPMYQSKYNSQRIRDNSRGIMSRKYPDLLWKSPELCLILDLDQREEMRTTAAGFKTEYHDNRLYSGSGFTWR